MTEYFVALVVIFGFLHASFRINNAFYPSKYLAQHAIIRIFGISFNACKRECIARQTCDSFNFCQKKTICELNWATNALNGTVTLLNKTTGWVYSRRDEWTALNKTIYCQCDTDERCEIRANKTWYCRVAECGSPDNTSGEYKTHGNVQTVGGKVIATCNENLWPLDNSHPHATLICNLTGNWERMNSFPLCGREVFRAFTGFNTGIYQAWTNEDSSTTDINCLQIPRPERCTLHYRHSDIDQWDSLNVSHVRFSIVKGVKQVHYILFAGKNSDAENWFSKERVIESSWTDLLTYDRDVCSIRGEKGLRFLHGLIIVCDSRKRFLISKLSTHCDQDAGWFLAINRQTVQPCCEYERAETLAMLYSKSGTVGVWSSATDIERADHVSVIMFTAN